MIKIKMLLLSALMFFLTNVAQAKIKLSHIAAGAVGAGVGYAIGKGGNNQQAPVMYFNPPKEPVADFTPRTFVDLCSQKIIDRALIESVYKGVIKKGVYAICIEYSMNDNKWRNPTILEFNNKIEADKCYQQLLKALS